MKLSRNIAIFVPHLGCPFRCSFCQQQHISAVNSPPSLESVREIIDTALTTIPDGTHVEIAFFGGTFTSIPLQSQTAYLDCARTYLESGQVQGIRISTRPDDINTVKLGLLKHYGVTTVELGVQSLDKEVLLLSQRGYSPEVVAPACDMVKQAGLRLGIQLMVGLPGDDPAKDLATTNAVIDLKPDMVRIYPTLVITGTELEQYLRQGRYVPLTLNEAVDITALMYCRFAQASIPVIRMGLHPGEDLQQPDTIVAGPFHPAFGEMVLQRIAYHQTLMLLDNYRKKYGMTTSPVLYCVPRELSQFTGWKRSNIEKLATHFGLSDLQLKTDTALPAGSLRLYGQDQNGTEMTLARKAVIDRLAMVDSMDGLRLGQGLSAPQ